MISATNVYEKKILHYWMVTSNNHKTYEVRSISSIFHLAIQKLKISFMFILCTRLTPCYILDNKPSKIGIASSIIFVDEEFSAVSSFLCKIDVKLTMYVTTLIKSWTHWQFDIICNSKTLVIIAGFFRRWLTQTRC